MKWSVAAVCLAAASPALWGAATSGIPADRLIPWRNHRRIHAIRSGRWTTYSWPVKLKAGVQRFELVAPGNRDAAVKDKIAESQELEVLDLTLARQAD